MNLLALISLISFFVYVYLGILVYLKHPESPVNRAFFILSLFAVYTSFTDFQQRTAPDFETAHFWFKNGVLWYMQVPALLHFCFAFTGVSQRKGGRWLFFPLYLISLMLALLDYHGNLVVEGPVKTPWGWSYGAIQETLIGNLSVAWFSVLLVTGIVLCLRYYLKVTEPEEKQRAKYVLIGTSIPMLAGVAEIVCSRLSIQIPNLLLLSIVIGGSFWAYAIWRYELFVLSPAASAQEIIQTMSDVLFLISPERKIKVVNQATLNLFGYERDELVDQPVKILFAPSDYESIVKDNILGELATNGYISDVEISVRTRHGERIPISLAGSLVRDRNGQTQGMAFIGRDITKRKQQDAELHHYKEELEERVQERTAELEKTYAQLQRAQKMEFMGNIAGGVAHDLNNILSGIVAYPDLLLLEMPPESPMKKSLLAIKRAGGKAATIVQDLLTLARREVSVKEMVNLNGIIHEYLQSPEKHQLFSYYPNVQIETHLDDDLKNLVGSHVHLSKIVMNLVHNGVEAMPDNGNLVITTGNREVTKPVPGYERIPSGTYVVLSVGDTGTGIAKEDMERIFEPFYSNKKMGKSGTGLGMAVVWGVVKDHGGFVDVESRLDEGTTFSIYFPACDHEVGKVADGVPVTHYQGKGERVLVVDDVAEQRDIATVILKKLGYDVHAVESGEMAVAYIQNQTVDILVLDMIMNPGIDGLDTYRQILSTNPGQKAVIASGFSENQRVKEAKALGAGAFIQKPYSLETLGLAIRTELDKTDEKT
ncbi:MAG: response regulator [Thermodesulfobacteriota bacterium]|nr:response regulator [Thermodesulfobacteriota bacterium]